MWWTNQTSVPTQTSARTMAPVTPTWGTKVPSSIGADGAQHHQRIGEGAEEDAERDLVAGVAHEVAQQPRPHLARSQGQGRDRDGEDRASDADARRRDGAEQRPRALAAAGVAPGRRGRVGRRRGQVVEPGREQRQADAKKHDEGGAKPELVAEILDPGTQAGVHAGCPAGRLSTATAMDMVDRRSSRRSGPPRLARLCHEACIHLSPGSAQDSLLGPAAKLPPSSNRSVMGRFNAACRASPVSPPSGCDLHVCDGMKESSPGRSERVAGSGSRHVFRAAAVERQPIGRRPCSVVVRLRRGGAARSQPQNGGACRAGEGAQPWPRPSGPNVAPRELAVR